MVQEARARAINPKAKTSALFEAVQKRGHKAAKGARAPRAYVYGGRVVWPRSASGLQAGALGDTGVSVVGYNTQHLLGIIPNTGYYTQQRSLYPTRFIPNH